MGALLVVDSEREFQLLEQASNGGLADVDSEPPEFLGDLLRCLMRPLQSRDRIASRLESHQGFDGRDDFGRFFSDGFLPPPGLRERPSRMSRSSSACRPLATVWTFTPRRSAIQPSLASNCRASSPANNRRCCSSSKLKKRMMAALTSSLSALSASGAACPAPSRACRESSWWVRTSASGEQYRYRPATFSRTTRSSFTSRQSGAFTST